MAQTADAGYKANAVKAVRVPVIDLNIAWGLTADDMGFAFDWAALSEDESARIKSITWSRQLDMQGPLAQGNSPVAVMRVELNNYDNRYSPFNEDGPLYADLMDTTTTPGGDEVTYPRMWQVPVRVRVGFESDPDRLTLFTGLIDQPDGTWGVSGSSVTLRCFDMGGMLLKRKLSTELHENITMYDWIIIMMQRVGMDAHIGSNMDNGLFLIPYVWLDDEDAYSECSKTAASEGGYFYFSETGKSVLRNAAWWAQKTDSTTSVFTFTVARFTDISPGYDWKSVATGALVEYQGRSPAGEQVVWKSSAGTIVCAPGTDENPGITTIEARLNYPCSQIYPPELTTDWFPVNSGGLDMSESVTASLDSYAQRTTITIRNSSSETAFITNFQLRGPALFGGPTEQIDRQVSVPLVPENVMRISGNPYIQTKAQADLVADLAVDRMQYPRLTYTLRGVPAIPWLQLGDRITITATEPITTSREAIITKLDFSWRPESMYAMSIEAIDAAGLFQYPAFFVLGTDNYGDPDAGVLFR